MFGIDDPFIILPYLLSVVCVIFAAWFGLKYWNEDFWGTYNIIEPTESLEHAMHKLKKQSR